MRLLDLSSWQGVLTSLLGLAVFALIGVGIRVLMMLTIQQRQQRMNRQINERLKTLIAAYRTLGGSFTGQLTVNPAHLRELRQPAQEGAEPEPDAATPNVPPSDRPRRIRDAVEAALSDILLLGTEDHVRLAAQAASDMAAGRPIHTAELVISLRAYIRRALDLEPIPEATPIPLQGPTRPQSGGARGGRDRAGGGAGGGGGGGGGMGGGGGGMGMGLGGARNQDTPPGG
ncbi:hypothetical protein GCM10011341_10500 [Frigidibacter albus]|uniref:hypothetical protein n=1 Tax=Frigidibacter albus TaxID=1465486 RepID=UPI0013CFCD80|nr:hypothetical protein [Frigidibacter albus]GGH48688.1 hypothetical protein GCM10011341_10500 [Frigidibacter albus]